MNSLLPRIPDVFKVPFPSRSYPSSSNEESAVAVASAEVAAAAAAAVSPMTSITGAVLSVDEIPPVAASVVAAAIAAAAETGVEMAASVAEMKIED